MTGDQQDVLLERPATRIVASAWPVDPEFLDALHRSWIGQYADYIGEPHATALVTQLLDAGELCAVGDALLLAMVGTELAGVAAFRPLKGLSLITMLEVLETYRYRGIGGRLIAGLQERTEQRLLAHVSVHRPQVLCFYENRGFSMLPRTWIDHYGHELEFDVMVK